MIQLKIADLALNTNHSLIHMQNVNVNKLVYYIYIYAHVSKCTNIVYKDISKSHLLMSSQF